MADPDVYSNLFEDWQIALSVESNISHKSRSSYLPAEQYPSHVEKLNLNLVEAFKSTQVDGGDFPLENGDSGYEVSEAIGEEEGQEGAVEVDTDEPTNGDVLVNGNNGDEEYRTNSGGNPPV